MTQSVKMQCRRCGGQLEPIIDDVKNRLCNTCLQQIEDRNYY